MKMIITLICLLSSMAALAQMKIEGRLYSLSDCNYYYSTTGDFNLSYNSFNLKKTKSVQFIVGFHNIWGNVDWASLQTIKATEINESLWTASLEGVTVSKLRLFAFDAIDFVAQIENTDGSIMFSRPTDVNSFYTAKLPTNYSCSRGEFETLQIQAK